MKRSMKWAIGIVAALLVLVPVTMWILHGYGWTPMYGGGWLERGAWADGPGGAVRGRMIEAYGAHGHGMTYGVPVVGMRGGFGNLLGLVWNVGILAALIYLGREVWRLRSGQPLTSAAAAPAAAAPVVLPQTDAAPATERSDTPPPTA